MAFYTADWVRKLVKEDHVALQAHIAKKGNDFRSYIDSTLPFTLYLDIDSIRKNILIPNSKFIIGLASVLKLKDTSGILTELDNAYKKTINYYIDSYDTLTRQQLADKLNSLKEAVELGGIKETIQAQFKNTVTISNLSKRNKSVLIMSPKFTTIQSKFGSVVKENFDLSSFSDNIDDELGDSPRNIMSKYLDKNFGVLNNLGHVEVDVISTVANSTEIKRGLVSPRLLQALIEWPKDSRPDLLTRKFSKETGQAQTRIKIRKKFTSTKLVLEMLIEAGMMIGSVESQEENLKKAPKERAFLIGQNLTSKIKADPSIITELETSKSLKKYLADAIISSIKTGKVEEYSSDTTLNVASIVSKESISITPSQKAASPVKLPTTSAASVRQTKEVSLTSLQNLINSHLQDVISANMGDGDQHNVLNYRTGRFAGSVKVEKLSRSREGMITAFYSYMKNPYQTFEPGFRQGSPKTRDPKLLISKSIREIAETRVKNKLRSVSI